MSMQCPKCDFNGNPNLEEVKMHTKATCPDCGTYIKMVGKDELEAIINATINSSTVEGSNSNDVEAILTIKTMAPSDYHPEILNRVKKSLERGFLSGEGIISKPFDKSPYSYDFCYK